MTRSLGNELSEDEIQKANLYNMMIYLQPSGRLSHSYILEYCIQNIQLVQFIEA